MSDDPFIKSSFTSFSADDEGPHSLLAHDLKALGAHREKKLRSIVPLSIFMALAASLLLVLYLPLSESDWTNKGGARVVVVVDHGGKRQIFNPIQKLIAGDRINIEITVAEPTVAWRRVFDRTGHSLTSMEEVTKGALDINAGQTLFFKEAIELTEPNDGEQLVITTCGKLAFAKEVVDTGSFVRSYLDSVPNEIESKKIPGFCRQKIVSLRH